MAFLGLLEPEAPRLPIAIVNPPMATITASADTDQAQRRKFVRFLMITDIYLFNNLCRSEVSLQPLGVAIPFDSRNFADYNQLSYVSLF